MWKEIGQALCLVLIIEGILPFLSPGRWRQMAAILATMDDRTLRAVAFGCMLLGLGLLYLTR